MIPATRSHKHPSSIANRPSHFGVTVNINAEINLMAGNPIIEFFSKHLMTEGCRSLECSMVYTVPPFFVETFPGRSNRGVPRLLLHLNAQEIIPTFLMSNIYIGQCLPTAVTLPALGSYEIFEVFLIVRINKRVGLQGILNFRV